MTPEETMNYAQIAASQQAYGPPQLPKGDRADLLDKLKPEILIETIRQRLMGKELVKGKWESIRALQEYALTEEGAWELANLLLGTTSLNTSISKLNDVEIKRRALEISRTAQYMCNANKTRYGIKNTAQLYFVDAIIFTNALVVFKQADGASIQELLKGTTYEQRSFINAPSGGRSKFGDILRGRWG